MTTRAIKTLDRNINNLPTFQHVMHRKSTKLSSHSSLYQASVQSLYKAFQLKNNRLAWQVYEKMCLDGFAYKLHPQDHTRMLGIFTHHIIPSIAAAHVTRVQFLMKQCHIKLDYRDYHAILLVHYINRDLKKVVSTFEEMKKNDLAPDGRSTSIVMACYAHYKDLSGVKETWELLNSIPGALESPDTLSIAIDSLSQAGDFSKAQYLFQEYLNTCKESPSPLPYEAMIRAYGVIGDIDKATTLFTTMQSKSLVGLESYDIMIEILEPGNYFEKARKYWNQLQVYSKGKNTIPLQSTMTRMMSFYSKQRNLQKVEELFDELKSNFVPCAKEYETLIWAYLEAKDEVSAIKWFDIMVDKGHHMSKLCLNTIAAAKKRREFLILP